MDTQSLQEVIRQYIPLSPRPNGRGFFTVLCKVCNDHGKKGKRAGFKFEGETVGYNCFNCGHSARYDPHEHTSMPHKMVEVLTAFGIPEDTWKGVLYRAFLLRTSGDAPAQVNRSTVTEPKALELPPYFYRLTDDKSDDIAQYAIEYLSDRHVNWTEH